MRLKQISLFGFKSFADKTVLTVPEGIVAIVGPNGCGKSNISDAVLWAIGEQSAKNLRGDRMEDVIFNGSERRKLMGMAEVSLGFSELHGSLTSRFGEFGELTVTRRLFRSGESEYLINKVPCRLKDIRDLLLEAGASFKGHTIIEQGKVDGLINASPVERRGLIEEVAGIAKYKIRKNETMRKLEATEQNLLRIKDIIGEVKRQINSLDRQARKAQTANRLSEQVRALELSLSASRVHAARRQFDEQSHLQGERCQSEAQQLATLASLEAEIEQLRLDETEAHQSIRSIEQELYQCESAHQQTTARLTHLQEQEETWKHEDEELRPEVRRVDETLTQQQAQVAQQQATWHSLKAEQQQRDEVLVRHRTDTEALERAHEQELQTQEELKRQLFTAMAAVSETRNRATLLEARVTTLQREQGRLTVERQRREEELAQLTAQLTHATTTKHELTHQLTKLQVTHHQLVAMLEQQRQDVTSIDQTRVTAQTALTEADIRLSSMQELETTLLGLQTELRETLTSYGPLQASERHEFMADLIDVTPPYERAIEAALGELLQAFVVDDMPTAQSAITFLNQHTAGRAFFIPKEAKGSAASVEPPPDDPHLIGPATALVRARPGVPTADVEAVVQRLLSRVWVVDELVHALRLSPFLPKDMVLVTVEGDLLLPNGVLCGGHSPQAGADQGYGLLQLRRSRQELETQIPELEKNVSELSHRLQLQQERLDTQTVDENVQRHALQALQVERLSHEKELERLAQAEERLREQVRLIEQELACAVQEREEVERQRHDVEGELTTLTGQHQRLEVQGAEQQSTVTRVAQEREAAQEQLTHLKVEVASGRERVEQAASTVTHLQQLVDHLAAQRDEKIARLQWLAEQRERVAGEREQLILDQRGRVAQLAELRERRRETLEAAEQRQAMHRMRQGEEKTLRRTLDQLQHAVADGERQLAEFTHRIDRIEDFVSTVYHLPLDQALAEAVPLAHQSGGDDATESLSEAALIEQAEQEVTALKAKRDQLGVVNPGAIDEYQELEQRFEFLSKQETDLTQSMEDLRAAITKINRTTRVLFLETFERLNQKFGELFGRFFQGGHARLSLLDESSPLESGIEIMAQPPGKRLRTIHLLSGGEKALTAISLLMASFLLAPNPFCLLDEIDAPLDEENVRRFTAVLRGMAQQTQFIIVTHNKQSMEAADQLYGVTMEEPGISRILGVRLDVADQLSVAPTVSA